MKLIIDLQYFPIVDYYFTLLQYNHIIFDQYERHQKLSFRNRCIIAGANGPINLSIPLVGGRDQKIAYKDVRIDNSVCWQSNHFKSIVSAYNRSPFFEFYRESLEHVFNRRFEFLQDWNLECLEWIRKISRSDWTHSYSDSYEIGYSADEVVDLRNHFHPRKTEYRSPERLTYRQVFSEKNGFLPNASVLDFLFCCGPNAISRYQGSGAN